MSITTAQAFWNSAFDANGNPTGNATLTLSPSDIYMIAGGKSRLSCHDLAPVVRHMGLYFATDGWQPTLGPGGMEIPGVAAATSPARFPMVGNTLSFESTSPQGLPLAIPALDGNTDDVLGNPQAGLQNFGAWPAELGTGAGISPFTSFQLDLRAFAPPATTATQAVLAHTRALFLVFDVDRRTSNPLAWVPGVCQFP